MFSPRFLYMRLFEKHGKSSFRSAGHGVVFARKPPYAQRRKTALKIFVAKALANMHGTAQGVLEICSPINLGARKVPC